MLIYKENKFTKYGLTDVWKSRKKRSEGFSTIENTCTSSRAKGDLHVPKFYSVCYNKKVSVLLVEVKITF